MYIIECPKTDFTGAAWGLSFLNGKAETANAHIAAKLQNKGYRVTLRSDAQPEDPKSTDDQSNETPELQTGQPFACVICGKEYASLSALKRHQHKEHHDTDGE